MRGGDYYKQKKILATPRESRSTSGSVQNQEVGSTDSDTAPPHKRSKPSSRSGPHHGTHARDQSSVTSSDDQEGVDVHD